MNSPHGSVIQIGAWHVDPALDEISRDGHTTKLEPKMMQLHACSRCTLSQETRAQQVRPKRRTADFSISPVALLP